MLDVGCGVGCGRLAAAEKLVGWWQALQRRAQWALHRRRRCSVVTLGLAQHHHCQLNWRLVMVIVEQRHELASTGIMIGTSQLDRTTQSCNHYRPQHHHLPQPQIHPAPLRSPPLQLQLHHDIPRHPCVLPRLQAQRQPQPLPLSFHWLLRILPAFPLVLRQVQSPPTPVANIDAWVHHPYCSCISHKLDSSHPRIACLHCWCACVASSC